MKVRKIKKSMSLLLVVALLATMLAACGGSGESKTQASSTTAAAENKTDVSVAEDQVFTDSGVTMVDGKRQINVGWEYTINSLTPIVAMGSSSAPYYYHVLETLVTSDSNYQMHNVLAKDWNIDDSGTVCTVEIYDYITDSEGTNITAEDVCFCIEKCNEKGIVSGLKAATPTGDYTLTIELEKYQLFAMERILSYCPIVSKAKYEASGDEMATKLIATGPYVIAEHVIGSTTTMEANENYWQKDDSLKGPYAYANVDRIKYITLSELSQREIALETGEVNYIHSPGASSIDLLGNDDTFVYTATPGAHTYTYFLSMRGVFADPKVREAFYYAIDRDALIQGGLNGYGFKIGIGLPSAHYDDSWTDGDHVEYNPEKARELLQEAGVLGKKVTIMGTANYSALNELIQAYLIAAGLDVEVVTEEAVAFSKDIKDYEKYDVFMARVQNMDSAYLYQYVSRHDSAVHPGHTMTGIQDEQLKALSDALDAPGGNTQENNNAIHDYLLANHYIYCPMRSCTLDMWRSDSGLVKLAYGNAYLPVFSSAEYIWNQ